jgi:signal transduction histidine kinase
VNQPVNSQSSDFPSLPLSLIREQILIGENLLDNTMQFFLHNLGVTHGLILESDLGQGKVFYQTARINKNTALIELSFYLCHRYRQQLATGTIILESASQNPFLDAQAAFVIVSLQISQVPLGFLCLYYQNIEQEKLQSYQKTIGQLAKQCALSVRQLQQLYTLERGEQGDQILPENSLDRVNEYLAHITHELRAPLAGILGFARMLQEQIYGTLTAKQYQYISAIASSGEHLLSLVNDFQDFSKIEANYEELFPEKLAVADVCLASLSIVQAKAEEQGLELTLDISPEVDFCQADQQRLKQILVNLLSNAIKFTEVGSVTLQVDICGDKLTFAVIDTGIGISLEEQKKLFQPFQQLNNSLTRKHKGTGLGLVLSRKLAQLHGGDIKLISEKGKGSCFILEIPR